MTEGIQRVDPAAWLALPADKTDDVTLPSGHVLKISSLTDGETEEVTKLAQRFDPRTKSQKFDPLRFKREVVAYSVNKAHGLSIGQSDYLTGDALKGRPVGELNELCRAVLELSGQTTDGETQDPDTLFG